MYISEQKWHDTTLQRHFDTRWYCSVLRGISSLHSGFVQCTSSYAQFFMCSYVERKDRIKIRLSVCYCVGISHVWVSQSARQLLQLFSRSASQLNARSVIRSICLSVPVACLSVCHSVCLPAYPSVRPLARPSVSQSVSQSVGQTVRQSDSQTVRQSDRQSVSQSVSQPARQPANQLVSQSVSPTVRRSDSQWVSQSEISRWFGQSVSPPTRTKN